MNLPDILGGLLTGGIASMVASSAGSAASPSRTTSLDKIVDNATKAVPGMEVAFIAFPGTPFSSSHHFAAFMRGDRPLTSRLLKPILLDAATARVADTRDLPFYLKAYSYRSRCILAITAECP